MLTYLDNKPQCLSAKTHRTPNGTDGDYFSKPSIDDVFERVYTFMHKFKPDEFPKLM